MKLKNPKVVAKGKIKDPLPEAGHARRELLKKRQDSLEEQIEEMPEAYVVDDEAFDLDNEMRAKLSNIEHVSNEDPNTAYCWADPTNHVLFTMAQNMGWKVVSGDDKEAREHKDANGYRRLGDVILMKMPKSRYESLGRLEAERVANQERAVTERLEELGRKFSRSGGKIHTTLDTMPDHLRKTIEARAQGQGLPTEVRKEAARGVAFQALDAKLRDGTIPGAEVRKR